MKIQAITIPNLNITAVLFYLSNVKLDKKISLHWPLLFQ